MAALAAVRGITYNAVDLDARDAVASRHPRSTEEDRMPRYMKAYYLADLRRFPGWTEQPRPTPTARDAGTTATSASTESVSDDIVYVQEDYRVTWDISGDVVFDGQQPGWIEFCQAELKFAVPDWEAESAAVRQALAESAARDATTGAAADVASR
jgi:hypothetical protein